MKDANQGDGKSAASTPASLKIQLICRNALSNGTEIGQHYYAVVNNKSAGAGEPSSARTNEQLIYQTELNDTLTPAQHLKNAKAQYDIFVKDYMKKIDLNLTGGYVSRVRAQSDMNAPREPSPQQQEGKHTAAARARSDSSPHRDLLP